MIVNYNQYTMARAYQLHHKKQYESIEVAVDGIDIDFQATFGGFIGVLNPKYMSIRTDAIIIVKLNSASSDPITIQNGVPFELENFKIDNIFITGTANVKVLTY